MLAYCYKCRIKIQSKKPQVIVTKGGQLIMEGVCPLCGAKVLKLAEDKALLTGN